jgi:hypothetical protein
VSMISISVGSITVKAMRPRLVPGFIAVLSRSKWEED